MKVRFWKKMSVVMPKSPYWLKMFMAKIFIRCLNDLANDIVLYNELDLWIKTKARPTTSNVNWWINRK
jgi:hypothetical protein